MSPDSRFLVAVFEKALNDEKGHDALRAGKPEYGFKLLESSSVEKTLSVWETETGEQRFSLPDQMGLHSPHTISPDSRFIVSASGKVLKIWDAATGTLRLSLKHTDPISYCEVSPDGRFIVSASQANFDPFIRVNRSHQDTMCNVWDVSTGALRFSVKNTRSSAKYVSDKPYVISPDSRFIVFLKSKKIEVVDVMTGKERFSLESFFNDIGHRNLASFLMCKSSHSFSVRK